MVLPVPRVGPGGTPHSPRRPRGALADIRVSPSRARRYVVVEGVVLVDSSSVAHFWKMAEISVVARPVLADSNPVSSVALTVGSQLSSTNTPLPASAIVARATHLVTRGLLDIAITPALLVPHYTADPTVGFASPRGPAASGLVSARPLDPDGLADPPADPDAADGRESASKLSIAGGGNGSMIRTFVVVQAMPLRATHAAKATPAQPSQVDLIRSRRVRGHSRPRSVAPQVAYRPRYRARQVRRARPADPRVFYLALAAYASYNE